MRIKFSSRLTAGLLLAGTLLGFGGTRLPPARAQKLAQTAPIGLPAAPVPKGAPAESEINAFWEADKKQMPPEGAVLFIGSSSIRLWKTLAEDLPEIPVINRGFGGSLLSESVLYASRIAIPYKPKIIVLFAGTNDLAAGKKPAQVFQDFQEFVQKIHASLPNTRIVYLPISPSVARWKNEGAVMETNYLIERYIVENNGPTNKLNFISTHDALLSPEGKPQPALLREDGLHLNADGYKLWTSVIRPRLLALADTDGVRRLNAAK